MHSGYLAPTVSHPPITPVLPLTPCRFFSHSCVFLSCFVTHQVYPGLSE